MRVCYFGTYRAGYVRNRLMIDRLRAQGVEVLECHARLWHGNEDRERAAGGGWRAPRFLLRVIFTYARLLWRYRHIGQYDVMVVGYPGQPDVPLARLLSRLRRAPLVWDILMSIYLIAQERGLDQRSPTGVSLIRWLEGLAIRLPDLLLVDTPEYAVWYRERYRVPAEKIRLLPLGADDRTFKPVSAPARPGNSFRCLYYGTFIPNHSVRTIVEAARLLSDHADIHFELIGQGPTLEADRALAQRYELENLAFLDWLSVEELVQRVATADLILGTFGVTPQALMTMQNKIHEGLAMAKAVINGDSPVMRSTLTHGENIFLCERENPAALAEAILTLQSDPDLKERIARQGHEYYQQNLSFAHLGQVLKADLEELISPP